MNARRDGAPQAAARLDDSLSTELPDDPILLQAVQEYLKRLEAGERPNRDEFLRRYPDLAEPLGRCLDGLDLVHRAAVPEERAAPGKPSLTPSQSEDLPVNTLGDFQILHEIGRGGMGVVYEAVQMSLGRRVALKVLPFAATFDEKYLQRFHNEAQAAARLHHTNIVPVYAVGCERGVHYYAMQLIEGQSLAALIRQVRKGSGRMAGEATIAQPSAEAKIVREDTETLPKVSQALSTHHSHRQREFFRTAARLLAQAAEGLEHAHQFGIVHRDIKPENLLVDEHGRLWITDFGVAQFNAESGLTRTGDLLGTLRYMSPEQASGQRVLLDHRTDVYSLGATLYELVTLEPIFPGNNREDLVRRIVHDEPRAPRSVDAAVPVELETIILKAVSKNPSERYGTARELAADLQRYLDDQPILAKRPSLLERARKWSRRHPSVLVASFVLLVLLTAGSLLSAWLIQGEQENTRIAYEQERQRAQEAEERFLIARRSVDELIRLAEEELAGRPELENLRKRLLLVALDYYREFIEQRRADPDAQADLALTQARVKTILDDLAVLRAAGQLDLIKAPAVLNDLQLSDDQRQQIILLSHSFISERDALFWEFHLLDLEARKEQRGSFLELARESAKEAAEILTPRQFQRLRQIELQLQGPTAFSEPDIAAELKLTAAQREQMRMIESDFLFGPTGKKGPAGKGKKGGPDDKFFGGKKGPKDKGFKEKKGKMGDKGFDGPPPEVRQEQERMMLKERMEKVLTTEQLEKWREITGKPFPGPPHFLPGTFGAKDKKGPKGPPDGPKK